MADRMTAEQRSRCMSRIRATHTKPEIAVRQWLWHHGFRYRLHVRRLPGSPDIVMHKHRIAIFVNGCFWHGHNAQPLPDGELADSPCCKIPHTRRPFWLDKIRRNAERDRRNAARLQALGWHVITVWECGLRPKHRLATLQRLLAQIDSILLRNSGYTPPASAYPRPSQDYPLPSSEQPLIAAEPTPHILPFLPQNRMI